MPRRLKLSRMPGRTLMLSRNDQPMAKKSVGQLLRRGAEGVSSLQLGGKIQTGSAQSETSAPIWRKSVLYTSQNTLSEAGGWLGTDHASVKSTLENYPLYTSAVTLPGQTKYPLGTRVRRRLYTRLRRGVAFQIEGAESRWQFLGCTQVRPGDLLELREPKGVAWCAWVIVTSASFWTGASSYGVKTFFAAPRVFIVLYGSCSS